jgi:methanogen homocitrate synthase
MGCALPQAIQYMVRSVKKLTGLPVEIHTHNDFGMGVATELAAVIAGAEVVHSCVNGLGERTGNAALEELMVGLHILLGMETQYNFGKIKDLSNLVGKFSRVQPPVNKPVVGESNYTRESGIGIDLVLKNPLAMFATNPQFFGREGKIVLGKKSGKASVKYTLERLGIHDMDDDSINAILKEVKAKGTENRALLSEMDFMEIVRSRKKRGKII